MAITQIIDKVANLWVYPARDTEHPTSLCSQIKTGDLHGNALKFLYFLIKQGILTLQNGLADYQALSTIYTKSIDNLSREDVEKFVEILRKAKTTPTSLLVGGDELADRGMNDIFTLLIYQTLVNGGVTVKTLLSNHGAAFLYPFEKGRTQDEAKRVQTYCRTLIGENQDISRINLGKLLERGIVTANEIEILVDEYYKSTLLLFDYTYNEEIKEFIIHTHAPVGWETLRAVAAYFGITFRDHTATELMETLDRCNAAFQDKLYAADTAQFTKQLHKDSCNFNGTHAPAKDFLAFIRLMWTRYSGSNNPAEHNEIVLPQSGEKPYCTTITHGHTGPMGLQGTLLAILQGEAVTAPLAEHLKTRMFNFDTDFGKSAELHSGQYLALYTQAITPGEIAIVDKKHHTMRERYANAPERTASAKEAAEKAKAARTAAKTAAETAIAAASSLPSPVSANAAEVLVLLSITHSLPHQSAALLTHGIFRHRHFPITATASNTPLIDDDEAQPISPRSYP